jgi:hypothetical protein
MVSSAKAKNGADPRKRTKRGVRDDALCGGVKTLTLVKKCNEVYSIPYSYIV